MYSSVTASFPKTEEWQLALNDGEQVQVYEQCADGWWLGKSKRNSVGFFPRDILAQHSSEFVQDKKLLFHSIQVKGFKVEMGFVSFIIHVNTKNKAQTYIKDKAMSEFRVLDQAVTAESPALTMATHLPPAWADNMDTKLIPSSQNERVKALEQYLNIINAHYKAKLIIYHWLFPHESLQLDEDMISTLQEMQSQAAENPNFLLPSSTPRASYNFRLSSIPVLAKIVASFDAFDVNSDTLTVEQGELIAILDINNINNQRGWWQIQKASGQVGLIPCLFAKNLTAPEISDFFKRDMTSLNLAVQTSETEKSKTKMDINNKGRNTKLEEVDITGSIQYIKPNEEKVENVNALNQKTSKRNPLKMNPQTASPSKMPVKAPVLTSDRPKKSSASGLNQFYQPGKPNLEKPQPKAEDFADVLLSPSKKRTKRQHKTLKKNGDGENNKAGTGTMQKKKHKSRRRKTKDANEIGENKNSSAFKQVNIAQRQIKKQANLRASVQLIQKSSKVSNLSNMFESGKTMKKQKDQPGSVNDLKDLGEAGHIESRLKQLSSNSLVKSEESMNKATKRLTGVKDLGNKFKDLQQLVGASLQSSSSVNKKGAAKGVTNKYGVDEVEAVHAKTEDVERVKDMLKQIKEENKEKLIILAAGDPQYEKYKKMLKVGLDEGAVENALERDGFDPAGFFQSLVAERTEIQDTYDEKLTRASVNRPKKSKGRSHIPSVLESVKGESDRNLVSSNFKPEALEKLSAEDEEYVLYRSMVKNGVDKDYIVSIMTSNGLDAGSFFDLLSRKGELPENYGKKPDLTEIESLDELFEEFHADDDHRNGHDHDDDSSEDGDERANAQLQPTNNAPEKARSKPDLPPLPPLKKELQLPPLPGKKKQNREDPTTKASSSMYKKYIDMQLAGITASAIQEEMFRDGLDPSKFDEEVLGI